MRKAILTAGGFWAFLAFGFIDNLKGPLLPEIVRGGWDYAQAGSLVLASYLGFVLATLTTGFLADRFSNRLVVWLSGLCLTAGGVGICLFSNYGWLLTCMAVTGYGLGAIELGANALMIQLHSASPGRYLNLLSVFHGCGSLVVPLIAAWLLAQHWHWQIIYACSGFFGLPLLILFWPSRNAASSSASAPTHVPTKTVKLWPAGFRPIMLGYYVLIAAYVAMELSVGTWVMEHLQVTHGFSLERSSQYLSAFFALLMLGRLAGAAIVDRFPYLTVVVSCLVISGLCLLLAIYGPTVTDQPGWLYLFPLSGLCMSVTFPTLTAAVSQLHRGQAGAIMGLLFAFGGLGGALGPWLVGLASQHFGLTHGLGLTLVMDLVAIAAWMWVSRLNVR